MLLMRKRNKKIKDKNDKKESKDKKERDWLEVLMCLYVLGFNKKNP